MNKKTKKMSKRQVQEEILKVCLRPRACTKVAMDRVKPEDRIDYAEYLFGDR